MKRVHEEKIGDCLVVVVQQGQGYRGSVFGGQKATDPIESTDLDGLIVQLRNLAGRLHPDYVGMDGAIQRFLRFFPGGFTDPQYKARERSYKEQVRENLLANAPLIEALSADRALADRARHGLTSNLLSQFEAARLNQVLRSDSGAAFLQAAAKFTQEPAQGYLQAMKKAVEPHGRASWPLLTYLPYFWAPECHMFLKPTATLDFAERTGSDFARVYSADFDLSVYSALLAMTQETQTAIASLEPKDRIDVQSFIWVVGAYTEDDA